MRYAIIRVGNTHHGDLSPGMLIVLPTKDVTVSPTALDKAVNFANPKGGWSSGELLCYTTDSQNVAIERNVP